jgi:hypothetical protein
MKLDVSRATCKQSAWEGGSARRSQSLARNTEWIAAGWRSAASRPALRKRDKQVVSAKRAAWAGFAGSVAVTSRTRVEVGLNCVHTECKDVVSGRNVHVQHWGWLVRLRSGAYSSWPSHGARFCEQNTRSGGEKASWTAVPVGHSSEACAPVAVLALGGRSHPRNTLILRARTHNAKCQTCRLYASNRQ